MTTFCADRDKSGGRIPRRQNIDLAGRLFNIRQSIVLLVRGDIFDCLLGLLDGSDGILIKRLLGLLLLLLALRLDIGPELPFRFLMLFLDI